MYYFEERSSERRLIHRAAASFPPRPNARPNAIANNSRTNINVLGGNSWRDKQLANMSNGIAP